MRKLQLTSRRVLATLMAVVLLAVLIPTVLTDTAAAADYVLVDDECYFWTEGGLRQVIEEYQWGNMTAHFVQSRDALDTEGQELVITSDLTIPSNIRVKAGGASVSVAEDATLTLEGELVLDVGNAVKGPGRFVNNGIYTKSRPATSMDELTSAIAAAAEDTTDDGAESSVSITADITADGDYTVPAGAVLVVEENRVLTVSGKLTVAAGAVLVIWGGVSSEGMVIDSGAGVTVAGWNCPVEKDGAGSSLHFGDSLVINGKLVNDGYVGCGYRDATCITVGAEASVQNTGALAGGLTMDWAIDPAAAIVNESELYVSYANRGHLTEGENIQYAAGENGYVVTRLMITDEGDNTAALQATIDELSAASKRDYEEFTLVVSSTEPGKALDFTVGCDITLGSEIETLVVQQLGEPADGAVPAFRVAEGHTLTVQPRGLMIVHVPMEVDGTLQVQANEQRRGTAICNGGLTVSGIMNTAGEIAVRGDGMTVNGTVDNTGYFGVYESGMTINGTVNNQAGSEIFVENMLTLAEGGRLTNKGTMRIQGDAVLNGTLDLSASEEFTVEGKLTRGESLTVIGEENLNHVPVVSTIEELTALLDDEGTSKVVLQLDGDYMLTQDLTIPGGKELQVRCGSDDAGYVLTVAEGVTLKLDTGASMWTQARLAVQGTMLLEESTWLSAVTGVTVAQGGAFVNNGGMCVEQNGMVLDGTLTVNAWTEIHGDLCANGTLNIENGNMEIDGQFIRGEGFVLNGDENMITVSCTVWQVSDLQAALNSGADQVYLRLAGDSTLAEDLTIPSGVGLSVNSAEEGQEPTLTVASGVTLTLEQGAMVDAGDGSYYTVQTVLGTSVPIVVDGQLVVNEDARFRVGNTSVTVTESGHVRNNGQVELDGSSALYVADGWDDHWTQGENAVLMERSSFDILQYEDPSAALTDYIHNLTVSERCDYEEVFVYASVSSADGQVFSLANDLTVPERVHLVFQYPVTAVRIEDGAALTVDGLMECREQQLVVNGSLTVNGRTYCSGDVLVGGSLTVSENAYMWCRYLTDTGEDGNGQGTIVNHGRLFADNYDIRHNDDPITPDDGGNTAVARTEERLRELLAQGRNVYYEGTELTLTADLEIPEGVEVNLCPDTVTVPEGITLTNRGTLRFETVLQLDGTLDVSAGQSCVLQGQLRRGENSQLIEGDDALYYVRTFSDPSEAADAFADPYTDRAALVLRSAYTLEQDMTVPAGRQLSVWGWGESGSISLTIAQGVTLTLAADGGDRDTQTPIVADGGGGMDTQLPVIVEGSLTLEGNERYNAWANLRGDLTVTDTGVVHNNGSFTVEAGLTVADAWDDHWIQGAYGHLTVRRSLWVEDGTDVAGELAQLLAETDSRADRNEVLLESRTERVVELNGDLTVPAGQSLNIFTNNITGLRVLPDASLTIQGNLYSHAPVWLNGSMTVGSHAEARVYNDVRVGGSLTINTDGYMWCDFLTDTGEDGTSHGTIVNNGRLNCGGYDIRYNDDPVTPDGGEKIVRTEEALRAALQAGGDIVYRGDLTLSADLEVPGNACLTFKDGTLTIPEDVTLTTRSNLSINGNLALYGKIDVTSGYMDGEGQILAGSRSQILGDNYNWSTRIEKTGNTETLTAAELDAAVNDIMSSIKVVVGRNTRLTLDVGSSYTMPEAQISFVANYEDGNGLIVVPGETALAWNDRWSDCQVPMEVNGTLTIWGDFQMHAPLTVNGELITYSTVHMHADMVIHQGGMLYLKEQMSDDGSYVQKRGRIVFHGTSELRLPDGGEQSDYVQVDNANEPAFTKSFQVNDGDVAALKAALETAAASSLPCTVDFYGKWDQAMQRLTATIPAGVELTVPANTTVYFTGDELTIAGGSDRQEPARLTVYGTVFRTYGDTALNGEITVTADGILDIWSSLDVSGSLTIAEGGKAEIQTLSDCDGAGTITNNGTLRVNSMVPGTVIGGSGETTIEKMEGTASDMETLRRLLDIAAADPKQSYSIRLEKAQESDEGFVITGDVTIPGNVVIMCSNGTYTGRIVIGEGANVILSGQIVDTAAELLVRGTLHVTPSGSVQGEDGMEVFIDSGYVNVGRLEIAETGTVNNEGAITTCDAADETAGQYSVMVDGKLTNNGHMYCTSLRHSGYYEMTNRGYLRIGEESTDNGVLLLSASQDGTVISTGTLYVYGRMEMSGGKMSVEGYMECTNAVINAQLDIFSTVEVSDVLDIQSGSVYVGGGGMLRYGSCTAPEKITREAGLYGDVNGDGVVDMADLAALARHVARIELLADLSRADINNDGRISAADVTMLAQILTDAGGTVYQIQDDVSVRSVS